MPGSGCFSLPPPHDSDIELGRYSSWEILPGLTIEILQIYDNNQGLPPFEEAFAEEDVT